MLVSGNCGKGGDNQWKSFLTLESDVGGSKTIGVTGRFEKTTEHLHGGISAKCLKT